jgi:hypothetical protein
VTVLPVITAELELTSNRGSAKKPISGCRGACFLLDQNQSTPGLTCCTLQRKDDSAPAGCIERTAHSFISCRPGESKVMQRIKPNSSKALFSYIDFPISASPMSIKTLATATRLGNIACFRNVGISGVDNHKCKILASADLNTGS